MKNSRRNFNSTYASTDNVDSFWREMRRDLELLEEFDISTSVDRWRRIIVARGIDENKQNNVDARLNHWTDTYHIDKWEWEENGDLTVYIKHHSNW